MPETAEAILTVWREYRGTRDGDLRNRLMENYLPLVKYTADRISAKLPSEVDVDDLVSAGIFGLLDAIEAFDLERGRQIRDLLLAAHPRRDPRRAADDGLGAAAGAQPRSQARKRNQVAAGRAGPRALRR